MRAARMTAVALLTASLALTGCAASDGAGDEKSVSGAEEAGRAPGPEGAADSDNASGEDRAGATQEGQRGAEARKPAAAPRQHVIRTAELAVEVGDATKALATARRVTEAAGGHVANESTERADDTHTTSRVVLRVPQERYESVLRELAGTGRLLSRTADAKDVTEQVVDVESRIATQRASVARVRALMDRATQLSEVVTLEGELSRRQADLESLLAQQASLKDRTTLATVTLSLTEKGTERPSEGEDRPGFLDALAGGWGALVTALAWVLVVLAALAPWLAVAAVLYAVWRWLVRPRLPRRPAPQLPPRPFPAPGARPSEAAPGAGPSAAAPAQRED
ncbi:DUF4349 domain-containing protein [Streptomyces sp. NPDC008121]|uniref:DUF4349 domain-containing protein n=1 Tax=Streptomyces sp. NPDC008121 TaxID=3364809 RepID=UPI0036E03563